MPQQMESDIVFEPASIGPITHMDIAYMAVAMRDPNPIHTEQSVAEEAGLPSVIAHGTFVLALCGAVVSQSPACQRLLSLNVRLTSPVFPGDRITAMAQVVQDSDDNRASTARVEAKKDDGTVVGTGEVSFIPVETE